MQSSTSSLSSAITSPHRVIGHDIQVDWDADGFGGAGSVDDMSHKFSSIKTTQSLNTTLPEPVRVVPGAAVTQLLGKIEQGNTFGIAKVLSYGGFSTDWSGINILATTATLTPPAGLLVGDLAVMVLAMPSVSTALTQTNVAWTVIASKSVYVVNASTGAFATNNIIRSMLLVRRITASEPTSYTFTFSNHTAYTAHITYIKNGAYVGIHEYSVLTRDSSQPDIINKQIQGRPITTTIDQCAILNFYLAFNSASSASWTGLSAGETVTDSGQSARGNTDIAFLSTRQMSAGIGTYIPGVTFDHSSQAVTFYSIAIAPLNPGDDRQNAAWTYSELNPISPIAGKQRDARPVNWNINFATSTGLEAVRAFTGYSLGVDASSRSRSATLTALDNRELFRSPTQINALMVALWPRPRPGETLPYYPGLESTSVVSYLLGRFDKSPANRDVYQTKSFYVAPPPLKNEALYAPCHGTLTPFIGDLYYAYTQRANTTQRVVGFDMGPYLAGTEKTPLSGFIGAKWGIYGGGNIIWNNTITAGSHYSSGRLEFCCRLDSASLGGHGFEFTVVNTLQASTNVLVFSSNTAAFSINITINAVTRTITGPVIPQDSAWHKLGVFWDSSTGSTIFYVDGVVTSVPFTPVTGTMAGVLGGYVTMLLTNLTSVAEIHLNGAISSPDTTGATFIYSGGSTLPISAATAWIWDNFTPTAFINRSINQLQAALWDGSKDIWTTLTEIAEADYSAVYFDSSGYPHFRTGLSDGTVSGQTIQRTLTTTNALKSIDYVSNVTMIANYITVPYSGVEFVLGGEPWTPSSPLMIPAHQSVSFIIQYPGLVPPFESNSLFLTSDPNTAADGTGSTYNRTIYTTITASIGAYISKNQTKWTIANLTSVDLWLVDNTGNNALHTLNSYVQAASTGLSPVVVEDQDSQTRHGLQTLQVQSTQWRQSLDSAKSLAQHFVSDLAEARPVLRNVNTVADPRLEIGDRVQFVDPTGLNVNDVYRLTGITTESAQGGLSQSLTARQSPSVARWGLNRWNDGTIWGSA